MRYEVLWSDIIRVSIVVEAESEDQAMDKAIEQADAMELKDMELTYGDDFQIDSVSPLEKGETHAAEDQHSEMTYCGQGRPVAGGRADLRGMQACRRAGIAWRPSAVCSAAELLRDSTLPQRRQAADSRHPIFRRCVLL